MFFGLCNSPAMFQAMMNDILKDELNDGWVIVYMDNILIFSKTKEGLEEMTKRVLQRLHENDLTSNPENANSAKHELNILDSSLKKAKCLWTLANLMAYNNGQSQRM